MKIQSVLLCLLCALCACGGLVEDDGASLDLRAGSVQGFVQQNYATPQSSPTTVNVTLSTPTTAGNALVVFVGNGNTTSAFTVTDSLGNTFTKAVGPTSAGGISQSAYYSLGIVGGTDVVHVAFSPAGADPDVRVAEYAGLAAFDSAASGHGTTSTSTSSNLTTTATGDLLVAGNFVDTSTTAAGSGWTNRVITSPDGDILEEKFAGAPGTYSATAPLSSAGAWIISVMAFKVTGSSDAGVDAAQEASVEAGQDAASDGGDSGTQDGGSDASLDAPSDSPPDAPFDAPFDAPLDSSDDSSADATVEAGQDASLDAGQDATVQDAGPDASVDAGQDATAGGSFTIVDPRYVVDGESRPFLLNGEAAWSLIVQLGTSDLETYLTDRQSRGVNALLINLIEHKFTTNPPFDVVGDGPFGSAAPFDMTKAPNVAYFTHVDDVLQRMANHGMIAFLTPSYLGYGGGDEGWYQSMETAGNTALLAYGKFLGARYASTPNIVWVAGGDFNPPDKTSTEAVVNGIRTFDTTHFWTAHADQASSAMDEWSGEPWMVRGFAFDTVYTQPSAGSNVYTGGWHNYGRTDWLSSFEIEADYENKSGVTSATVRQEMYEAVLSGGFGSFRGDENLWPFGGPGVFGQHPWQPELNTQGTRDQQHVLALLGARRWERLVPDVAGTFLLSGAQSGTNHATAARAGDGTWAATYVPNSRSLKFDLSGFAQSVAGTWIDPTGGVSHVMTGSPFANTGTVTVTPPGANSAGDTDWVAVFE